MDRITHSAGVVVPFAILGLSLSAGLLRTRTAPAWTAWALGAGAVLLAMRETMRRLKAAGEA